MEQKLSPLSKRQIVRILDKSKFTKHAFELREDLDELLFRISFLYDKEYFFVAKYGGPSKDSYETVIVTCCPGDRLMTFTDDYYTIDEEDEEPSDAFALMYARLEKWVSHVDIAAELFTDARGHINKIKENIEAKIKENPEDAGEAFTKSEIEAILRHLEKVEKDYEALKEKAALSEQTLKEFQATIGMLTNQLHFATRGNWFRLYTHKMLNSAEKVWHFMDVRTLLLEATSKVAEGTVKGLLESAKQ